MSKSKTRLIADFMGKVQLNPSTGVVEHSDIADVTDTVNSTITGALYNTTQIDAMFDDVIAQIENLSTPSV